MHGTEIERREKHFNWKSKVSSTYYVQSHQICRGCNRHMFCYSDNKSTSSNIDVFDGVKRSSGNRAWDFKSECKFDVFASIEMALKVKLNLFAIDGIDSKLIEMPLCNVTETIY